MRKVFKVLTKHFIEFEVELPMKFEVCDRCRGNGTHVNPNIDDNGISSDEFDQDPDFKESYLRGDYDVRCEECDGQRVIAVVDEERCSPRMLERYYRWVEQDAQNRAETRQRFRDMERGIHY